MVFHVVEIKGVQKINETLLSFFELIKEFLSMRSSLSGCSSTDMFLDLFPLLAMNFESLKKPEMLILGPAASFVRGNSAQLLEGVGSILRNLHGGFRQ
jgi:hypothetical protein